MQGSLVPCVGDGYDLHSDGALNGLQRATQCDTVALTVCVASTGVYPTASPDAPNSAGAPNDTQCAHHTSDSQQSNELPLGLNTKGKTLHTIQIDACRSRWGAYNTAHDHTPLTGQRKPTCSRPQPQLQHSLLHAPHVLLLPTAGCTTESDAAGAPPCC